MKFSIITPVYNKEKYIAETIESVLFQKGDFEIEYIVVDNCSNDTSLLIAKKYEDQVSNGSIKINCNSVSMYCISEKDDGMYDAINKGFALATGDVYAYINADDIYLCDAFSQIQNVFKNFLDIKWVKGITSYIDDDSEITSKGSCFFYNRDWLVKGIYGPDAYFVQQDSVFWRADLWKSIGGIDSSLKLAGDYFLWVRFAELTKLISLNFNISCFRRLNNQLSTDIGSYFKECNYVRKRGCWSSLVKLYFQNCDGETPTVANRFFYLLVNKFRVHCYLSIINNKVLYKSSFYYKLTKNDE